MPRPYTLPAHRTDMESPSENQPLSPEELSSEELEFKPVVKYAAIGLAIVTLLGVEYATYKLGFSNGFTSGVTSEVVSEAVNNAAVENLTHFMQAATADEATLLHTVRTRETGLAWIKNPSVRREAEWMLALATMNRGKVADAADMLKALFPRDEASELWARRAVLTARSFAETGDSKSAVAYYRYASRCYGKLGRQREQLGAYSEQAELIASAAENSAAQLKALETLQTEVANLGEPGKLLQANLLAYMGRIHRSHGKHQEALKCFEKALTGVDLDKVPTLAGAAVCMGSALLEKGDTEQAARLLRDGVSRLGEHPGDAVYLASALRDLARIELESSNSENALALLYRAEGAAMGRIDAADPYWACLYDQRGWVNFAKEAHEAALADFSRALASGSMPEELRAQPLEGAGRCCIVLGRIDEALSYLQEAVKLRSTHFAADKTALGRVYLALAQVYDMDGKTRDAANAYALAAQNLPKETGEDNDRFQAMMSQAYALSQLRDWNAAIQTWDALRSEVQKGSPRAREVEEQFNLCRLHGASLPEEVDTDEGEQTDTSEH